MTVDVSSASWHWLDVLNSDSLHVIIAPGVRSLLGVRLGGHQSSFELTLDAQASSEVTLFVLADAGMEGQALRIRERGYVREAATVRYVHVAYGSEIDWSLYSHLVGADAKSSVDWACRGVGNHHQAMRAHNVFDAPRGGGEITLMGVVEEHATTECHGMIEITERGQGTETYLTESVLMLDATAKIDAVPGLEIRTNDVKASHSATVSRITPDDLFYFRSRGIDAESARRMFVEGFLTSALQSIDASLVPDAMATLRLRS